jgi:putative transposase
MWKERTAHRIMLKLWDGKTWRWVRFRLWARDLPEGWEAKSPQVVQKGRRWWLHTPVENTFPKPAKAERQVKTNPDLRICMVDQNINDALAVCTIRQADGTVIATRFIRGGRKLHSRRKRLLGTVARNRCSTGIIAEGEEDNANLWAKIRAIDKNEAHRVSRRIVDFALEYGASMIVFEHLAKFRPQKGKYSKRGNEKRSYWLRGRIFRYTRYKAWEFAILTCRVNPRNTSRRCGNLLPNGEVYGHEVARYGEAEPPAGYRPGAPLYYCPACGSRENADRNSTLNIGHKFFARYIQSTHSEKPPAHPLPDGSSKEGGVSLPHDAENVGKPAWPIPKGTGRVDRHGTACMELNGAAFAPDGIPRPLRPQGGGGHAAITPSAAYAGVPEEAAGL